MKRLVATLALFRGLAIPVVSVAAHPAHSASSTRHCGSFKFGIDGQRPGPGLITAKNVSCWFARATALLGAAPGWHCGNSTSIIFTCKPKHGNGVVTFGGE